MSKLMGIIQRLKVMQDAKETGEVQQRRFEVNGKTLCQVKYFPNNDTFEVEVFEDDKPAQKYQFDDIDMASIDIFEIVQEEVNPA
ncbi:YkuJ family protein [Mangrovibacillus cuniculi]|uniref:YkuJ family protein n=1 Tax=Mangrovibacillus cuniculi TaxID=2593652 RepID=A0A7S8HEX4_9BACI|nr:YkuJ family protein [Mangrovibacillus cuniculi]QPC46177.1 YkuJ family protein [Mangrovibacillus cuniculi]